ncbi:MAG: phosphodiester glycosidase family protein [Eubacteriales bacterium]|nr:phosphodiester glycosidase family protein [Eubacteriales bacterium]
MAKKKQGINPSILIIVVLALIAVAAMVVILMNKGNKGDSPTAQGDSTIAPASEQPVNTAQISVPATQQPTTEPTNTPEVYPEGDFSATFPTYDTGTDADYSYQSDNIRIAIREDRRINTTFYVADIYVRNVDLLSTALVDDKVGGNHHDYTHNIAASVDALFAINGDYCGNRHEGIVIRNGILYRDTLNEDTCVLYKDGTMVTYSSDETSGETYVANGALQVWSFGPELLENGQVRDDFTEGIKGCNPRTLIGYVAPGHYIIVVVDGRQESSVGMTFHECSELMSDLGCTVAYNLDGGQSTEMVFQGQIINSPTDGGRHCSDIVYLPKR